MAAEAARKGSPLRLVFSSTGAVYGRAAEQPIKESAPMDPLNAYASTKTAAEDMIRWQATTGEIGAVALGLFNVAGAVNGLGDPDLSRIIPKAAAVALGKEAEVVVNGDGTAIRDFVHVADVAKAIATGVEICEPGRHDVFNVGATPASVLDIVAAAERISGQAVAVRHRDANAAEAPVLTADTTRLRERGWTPTSSDLDRIVRDQLDSVR